MTEIRTEFIFWRAFFFGRGIFPRALFFFLAQHFFFFGDSKIARPDSPGLSEAAVQQTYLGEGAGAFYVAQPPGAQAPLRQAPRVCELRRGMVWRAAAEVQTLTWFWAVLQKVANRSAAALSRWRRTGAVLQ